MTLDPERFPLEKVRELVDHLHERDQKFTVMVDPAVAYFPDANYSTLDEGIARDIFLKQEDG